MAKGQVVVYDQLVLRFFKGFPIPTILRKIFELFKFVSVGELRDSSHA